MSHLFFRYISITANYTDQWEKWWKNPDQVKLYQFMGKDNVPFHTVIFPCSLIGSGDAYTLLHHVSTTEFLNYEDGKFSKSRGIGVFGNNVQDTGLSVNLWRYYLLANRPECKPTRKRSCYLLFFFVCVCVCAAKDSQFTWNDFVLRINSELVANLGNFVSRVLKFCKVKFGGVVPEIHLKDVDKAFLAEISGKLKNYIEALEGVKLREGLIVLMDISRTGNEFLTSNSLNNALYENDNARCGTLIAIAVNLAYVLASLIHPYMPSASDTILKQIHAPVSAFLV